MIKKTKHIRKNGEIKTQITVVEGYRPAPGAPTKQRTIKDFGYLESQTDLESFWEKVNACNDELKNKKVDLSISFSKKNRDPSNRKYNYGYIFLKSIYDQLDFKSFFKHIKFSGNYDINEIFEFLVLQRILVPDSKRATTSAIKTLYLKDLHFSLSDVYNALTIIDRVKDELQLHVHKKLSSLIDRDMSLAFLDATNFDTTIDFPRDDNDFRQKGVAKSHTLDPIVQMGLFIDNNGLPMAMSVFSGNTSDSLILKPTLENIMTNYNVERVVVVADKGLNSSNNIDYLCNNGNGYLFSQTIRGTKGKRYHETLFDESGYIYNSKRTYKYKTFIEKYKGKDANGNVIERQRKVLIYWDKNNADYAKKKRKDKVAKAEKSLKNNAYAIKHSYEEYIKEESVITNTGEVADKKVRSINEKKIEEDAKFDGYFCIVTSELEYDERKMRSTYGSLWVIEDSFKVGKSDLLFRPIFVRSNSHISAHFQICFMALLIIRLFQQALSKNIIFRNISVERIQRVLNACTCEVISAGCVHLHEIGGTRKYENIISEKGKEIYNTQLSNNDEIWEDFKAIQKTFSVNLDYAYVKQEGFNKILKRIKFPF